MAIYNDNNENAYTMENGKIKELTFENNKVNKIILDNNTIFDTNNENIRIFAKYSTIKEKRMNDTKKWIEELNPIEKAKFLEMKASKDKENCPEKRKEIRDKFYEWLQQNRQNLVQDNSTVEQSSIPQSN